MILVQPVVNIILGTLISNLQVILFGNKEFFLSETIIKNIHQIMCVNCEYVCQYF